MNAYRLRCYECKKRKPEDDTTLIRAKVGGDYRRAARNAEVRVCRECAERQVEYIRANPDISVAVNTGRMQWEQAARRFGLDLSGLLLDRMTGRREPTGVEAEPR